MRTESRKAFRELGFKPGCTRNCDGRESGDTPLNIVFGKVARLYDSEARKPAFAKQPVNEEQH
ncbi:hypothetical protein V5J35_001471 [Endozoicomonas sp. NE40]|uniref:Uncharacterized protein n=1 Tax=Endozoicomonas lisbonensis TaxID=3120522 RepID=A0ABV2SEU1_9GAMM